MLVNLVLQRYLFCVIPVRTKMCLHAGNIQIQCPPISSKSTAAALSLCLFEVQIY